MKHTSRDSARGRRAGRAASALLVALCVVIPAVMGAASAQTTVSTSTGLKPDPASTITSRISAGCVLGIRVESAPELNGAYPVDTAGNIHFKLADDSGMHQQDVGVPVGGKTAAEATHAVADALGQYIISPRLQLVIERLPRVRVMLEGTAVRRAGPCELALPAHLSDALLVADLRPGADLAHVRIERGPASTGGSAGGGASRTTVVDVAAYDRGDSNVDPLVQNDDRVTVALLPTSAAVPVPAFVRVYGAVVHEAVLPLAPGMKVLDAFTGAGGLEPDGVGAQVFLVRASDGKTLELDSNRVAAKDPVYDLPLAAGDVIIVGKRDRSQRYGVLGEVRKPGMFDYDPAIKLTLTLALEQCGGVTMNGDARKGVLEKGYFVDPTKSQNIAFDLTLIAAHRQPDWPIEAGDAIVIPPKPHRRPLWQTLLPLLLQFIPL